MAVVMIQGCTVKDSTLKVSHHADGNFVGPLEQLQGVNFQMPEMADDREDKMRIGWKKNGYGHRMAGILTEQPVTEIVQNAIVTAFKSNQQLMTDEGDVLIEGKVTNFWFEADINFWTVEFIGDVQVMLSFIDRNSGDVIYQSNYSGTYSDKKAGGGEKTWQEVMMLAVDKLIEDIVFDEELIESLDQ